MKEKSAEKNLKSSNAKKGFLNYLFSSEASWYWLVIIATVFSLFLTFFAGEDGSFIYSRYIFGIILVVILPGYSILRAFQLTVKLNWLENILFSIGISISLTYIVGLALNFTALGITTIPILVCLSSITLIAASVGLLKEFKYG